VIVSVTLLPSQTAINGAGIHALVGIAVFKFKVFHTVYV
jgi:hypothetical protein